MTIDTSREAVEALIARARDAEKYDLLQTFFPQAKPSDRLGTVMVDTLAALLDERDRLAANRDAWVSDAMTSTTELEQRIRDLEATVDNLRLISNANGDWNIKYQEVNHRAERAEAERDEARTALDTQMSYVDRALAAEAERDLEREPTSEDYRRALDAALSGSEPDDRGGK